MMPLLDSFGVSLIAGTSIGLVLVLPMRLAID